MILTEEEIRALYKEDQGMITFARAIEEAIICKVTSEKVLAELKKKK